LGRKKATEGSLHDAMPRAYPDRIAARSSIGIFVEVFMPGFSSMKRLCLIAATMASVSLPAAVGLAQTAPSSGAAPAATAPAATPPAAATAPAAAAPPPAAATTAAPAATTTAAEPAKPTKKKAAKKMTRQQEIDKSIDTGTVPARYRTQVPKQYHHLIPFDKR
jgi:cell division septation protein DedD